MPKELTEVMVKFFWDSVVPFIIFPDVFITVTNRLRLNKVNKLDNGLIVDKVFLKRLYGTRLDTINFTGKEVLEPYVLKLADHVSGEDMFNAYSNISSIKIKKEPLKILAFIGGSYNPKDNILSYGLISKLGHELLHAVSSRYDAVKDIVLSGFRQQKGTVYIGRGINEGYTQLLSRRFFNDKSKMHVWLVRFMELAECFFENPKELEHLYFNSNLPDFIKGLEKYSSRQEVIDLITSVDSIEVYSMFPFSPMKLVKSIKAEIKLYNWFMAKNIVPLKRKEFEELIFKRKITALIIKAKKLKLYDSVFYVENEHVKTA